jgi:DNA polymerase-4
VKVTRERKSMSKETTFRENRTSLEELDEAMRPMLRGLRESLAQKGDELVVKSLVVKLKFADFDLTTAERGGIGIDEEIFAELLAEAWQRGTGRAVRLLGVGVKFAAKEKKAQLEFEM